MIVRCKNTYGDGTVEYVEYEVEDPVEIDDSGEATIEDYESALSELGVDVDVDEG